jgi:hypothetical protein
LPREEVKCEENLLEEGKMLKIEDSVVKGVKRQLRMAAMAHKTIGILPLTCAGGEVKCDAMTITSSFAGYQLIFHHPTVDEK